MVPKTNQSKEVILESETISWRHRLVLDRRNQSVQHVLRIHRAIETNSASVNLHRHVTIHSVLRAEGDNLLVKTMYSLTLNPNGLGLRPRRNVGPPMTHSAKVAAGM